MSYMGTTRLQLFDVPVYDPTKGTISQRNMENADLNNLDRPGFLANSLVVISVHIARIVLRDRRFSHFAALVGLRYCMFHMF